MMVRVYPTRVYEDLLKLSLDQFLLIFADEPAAIVYAN